MQPVALADGVELTPGGARRRRATRSICPGVERREPRRRARCAAFRERTGWDGAAGAADDRQAHPGRGRHGRRLGRRRRGAAARRARGAGVDDERAAARDRRRRSAPTSPRSSRPRRCLATGAGERLHALPTLAAVRRARAPVARARLSTADVYREADRLGLPRSGRRPRRARLRRGARAGAPSSSPDELLVNDLEPAARSLCPAIDDALDAPCAAPAPGERWSAARGRPWSGLFARPRTGARGAPPRARRRVPARRSPSSPAARPRRCEAASALALRGRAGRRSWSCAGAGSSRTLLDRRRRSRSSLAVVYGTGLVQLPEPRAAARSTSASALGQLDLPARRRRWPSSRPAPSSACSPPARPRMILGGVVAGQGQIDVVALIGDRLGRARSPATARATTSAAGSGASSWSSTARGCRSPRSASSQVEDFFDRHGGKAIFIGRFVGLVRAIAPFLAGSSADAVPALPALRRPRRRACGRRRSSCSATSSGTASTSVLDVAKKGALALGTVISVVVGLVWTRALCARRRTARGARVARPRRPSARRCARCVRRARARSRAACGAPARFVWRPPDARRPRARAHDAAGHRGGRRLRLRRRPRRRLATARVPRRRRARARLADDLARDRARRRREGRHASSARCRSPSTSLVAARRARAARRAGARRRRSCSAPGCVLTFVAVHIAKAAVDRPRPPDALVDVARLSFPVGPRGLRGRLGRAGDRAGAACCPALRGRWRSCSSAVDRRARWSALRACTCACTGSPTSSAAGAGAAAICCASAAIVGAGRRASCVTMATRRMSNESIISWSPRAAASSGSRPGSGLIVVPAWQSYSRVWERLAAVFLSLYVLAGFMLRRRRRAAPRSIWFWDRITV